jgi:hypothetical protein
MSAGKGYCRQDFRRHTLSVGKALYRRTVRRYLGVLPSDNPLAILCHGVVEADRWRLGAVGSPDTVRCTPDSLVNYSRTPLISSREQQVRLRQPGEPDTVRCTTGHCSVHHRTLSGALRQSCLWLDKANSLPIRFLLFPALRHNTLVSKTMY